MKMTGYSLSLFVCLGWMAFYSLLSCNPFSESGNSRKTRDAIVLDSVAIESRAQLSVTVRDTTALKSLSELLHHGEPFTSKHVRNARLTYMLHGYSGKITFQFLLYDNQPEGPFIAFEGEDYMVPDLHGFVDSLFEANLRLQIPTTP